jgi:hypothetical protein
MAGDSRTRRRSTDRHTRTASSSPQLLSNKAPAFYAKKKQEVRREKTILPLAGKQNHGGATAPPTYSTNQQNTT